MKNAVSIQLQLTTEQAEALLVHLREQLRQEVYQRWYADPFRGIPDGLRSGAILQANPALAAQKKALGALRAAVDQQA